MKKILLCGPWVGEFGWELFCWQGHLRNLSKDFDEVKVIGRPGHELLYEDFCSEYIEYDPKNTMTNMFFCENYIHPEKLINSIPHTHYIKGIFNIGINYTGKKLYDNRGLFRQQKFIKYTNRDISTIKYEYDIIFHCRNKKTGSERNWDKKKWEELKRILPSDKKICCIGNHESFYIEGTDDLRGITLSELSNLFNQSKIIVGPSSGPMHFASLCGLKHLVWSSNFNKLRYEKEWNPLNTEVIFYDYGEWDPDVEEIKKIILKNI